MIAMKTETPEFMLGEGEGKAFMDAAQNVMRHYSVQTTQKALDWIAFMGVASGMYVPRIAAVAVRKKQGKRQQQPARQGPSMTVPQAAPIIQPDQFGQGFSEAAE